MDKTLLVPLDNTEVSEKMIREADVDGDGQVTALGDGLMVLRKLIGPAFAGDAIMEAAEAGIKVIVAITEGIPIADMIKANNYVKKMNAILVGPNCPGVITPDEAKVGIMPRERIIRRGDEYSINNMVKKVL